MIEWVSASLVSSTFVVAAILYLVLGYPDYFNRMERGGLCLIMASMVLRMVPMVCTNLFDMASPFDQWSTVLLNAGLVLYLGGHLSRIRLTV